MKLTDMVFRRAEMGSAGCPPRNHIEAASRTMADELAWNERREADEIEEVLTAYAPLDALN